MKRTFLRFALLLAAAVPFGLPAAAEAQLNVSRMQMVPSGGGADHARVTADLRALFDAQRAFYHTNGRFAASLDELPGFALTSGYVRLHGGDDWYVALGGTLETGISQEVVTVTRPATGTESVAVAPGQRVRLATVQPDDPDRASNFRYGWTWTSSGGVPELPLP